MSTVQLATQVPTFTVEVEEFARRKGVRRYLPALVELAERSFPAPVIVSVDQDAEDETYQYIALDVVAGDLTAEQLFTGLRSWSAGVAGVCPGTAAVFFVLGWQ